MTLTTTACNGVGIRRPGDSFLLAFFVAHPFPSFNSPTTHQIPAPASSLAKVLAGMRHTFVVADATLPDCPLVYASEG